MSDWLDGDEESPGTALVVVEPGDPIERIRLFDKAWNALSQPQKTFLTVWKDARYSFARAKRQRPDLVPDQSTWWRWRNKNENFALAEKIIKADATRDVLERERLILRQDQCVEELLDPKPILHQGFDTGFRENNPAAAAKANETLLRVGGHLRDEQAAAPIGGPALIVQVTTKIGEVVSQTAIGVVPVAPPPDDGWLDGDS